MPRLANRLKDKRRLCGKIDKRSGKWREVTLTVLFIFTSEKLGAEIFL